MIWNPASILRVRFGGKAAARQVSARWQRAKARDPELIGDLIRLGGVMELPTVDMSEGIAEVVDKTPYQLGVEAGRRALALELLALAKIDPTELEDRMEQTQ